MIDKKITIIPWLERIDNIYSGLKQLYTENIIDADLNLLNAEKNNMH